MRDETVDWVAALTRILAPFEGDAPRYRTGLWRRAFTGRWFTEPEGTSFPHEHLGALREVIVDRILSTSFIAMLPPEELARVEAQLQTLVATHPRLRDRATVAFPYRTEAFRCGKRTA